MKKRQQRTDTKRAAPVVKGDGFVSAISGFGTLGQDKRQGHRAGVMALGRQELEMLWAGDDIGGRIVEMIPEECLRQGWAITCGADLVRSLNARVALDALDIDGLLFEAMCYERAFGGGAIVLGIDDGGDPQEAVDEARVRGVSWATAVEASDLTPAYWYSDPTKPKFGKPSIYRLSVHSPGPSIDGATMSANMMVHETRVVPFEGVRTTRRRSAPESSPGWGDSVFVRCYEAIRDFSNAYAGAGAIALDFSQPILSITGLAELISTEGGEELLRARMRAIEVARSILKCVFIDSQDNFERKTTNVSGLPELLDRLANRLASATGIPVTMLMGQAPAGMNATGDADTRFFYDKIKSVQERKLRPKIQRIAKLVMLGQGGEPKDWAVTFTSLWQPTEKERAEARNIQANTDAIYIDRGVLGANEVAASRFGGAEFSFETVIDMSARPSGEDFEQKGGEDNDQGFETKGRGQPPSEVGMEQDPESL